MPRPFVLWCTAGLFLLTDGKKRDFGLEGIQALAQHCTNLESVNFSQCFQLADTALRALGRSCMQLTTINLNGCPNVRSCLCLCYN